MEPRRLRETSESGEVTADPIQGEVNKGTTARGSIGAELFVDSRLFADQLPVVPATLDVPEGHLGVLMREGKPEV
jgi:hypothetical protein